MASTKLRLRIIWTLSILLALTFLLTGSGKILNGPTGVGNWDAQFAEWGYPPWARWIVGFTEVGAAIALLVPRVRFYGAAVLVPTMLGAVMTHFANQEPVAGIVPAMLGLLVGVVAWTTRPVWVQNRMGFAQVA